MNDALLRIEREEIARGMTLMYKTLLDGASRGIAEMLPGAGSDFPDQLRAAGATLTANTMERASAMIAELRITLIRDVVHCADRLFELGQEMSREPDTAENPRCPCGGCEE